MFLKKYHAGDRAILDSNMYKVFRKKPGCFHHVMYWKVPVVNS